MHTMPSDQEHANCDGWIYVGDGNITQSDGTRVFGPKFHPCGTCELLGRATKDVSITTQVDPFTLVSNPRELDIPF